MKVLFFMRHQGYVRNYQSALRELAERGHAIHLVFDSTRPPWLEGRDPLAAVCASASGVTSGLGPELGRSFLARAHRDLRVSLDYFRYFEPQHRDMHKLRVRASRHVPRPVRILPGLEHGAVRRPLASLLRLQVRMLPGARAADQFIAEQRPDVVLVTPLLATGSPQVDYVRAARRLRIPSVHCVASWDNLTTKGLLHEVPDAVLVWNEAQQDEAMKLHGIPAERIVVTGAQCYDHWFGREPSSSREAFCGRVGLRADRSLLLYLCSSRFIAPDEVRFVRTWLAALRSSRSPLLEAGVLVRPHPQNSAQWSEVDLGDRQATIWPRAGADPVDAPAQADYFDSMAHAGAVVGLNTSGLIESAIVGTPVHTLCTPAFQATQSGTLHFAHIAGERGVLDVAQTMDEHLRRLAESVGGVSRDDRRLAFLERFVRPHGLDRPATQTFADAVERLAA